MTLLSGALKINSGELVDTIHQTAEKFGAKNRWGPEPTQTGVRRLALSDYDKEVKDWFIQQAKSLGCKVIVDEVGNIFATFPGKNRDAKPTGMGSHLDTQPTGGRYDGIFGVLSGLQVLRTLKANDYVPNYPITLVDWCNEEGARFPMSLMSSSVWAGISTKEHVYGLKDVYDNKTTVLEELNRIGYKGSVESSHVANPLNCHFEIHIEQGPILEMMGKRIGVLTSAQAFRWLDVTFKGMPQHTGTTPLEYRRDALLATAKVITGINEIGKKHHGVASVGMMSLSPNVVNVIPGEVSFVVDIRHHTDEGLHKIYTDVRALIDEITLNKAGNGIPLEVEIGDPYPIPTTVFHTDLVDLIEECAYSVVGEENTHRMVSGAGHDSCATGSVIPTAMIFVPSKNGISHNPEEYTKPDELEAGFRVLLETILRYDQERVE
ncbi:hypothetical protein FOA43_002648 [Brettanomyces nanus]|uniref:Peptidase M20 dimerisation domain-containing protein n=1 Tax=Eeniella nana TaxID=13502 RepID=A0A875RV69_EENNA|nr:uncharacterized protein FOA43_002648 [Brettanomyces nanus]QPG75297.1 hypothetical protein FOA43_002648 [Brettanomyces nanus]